MFFAIWEFSTKLTEHFVFLSVKHQPFVFILLEQACFWAGAGDSDAVLIFLYHLMIANFLQRKSPVCLTVVSVSTYFGSRFNSPLKGK